MTATHVEPDRKPIALRATDAKASRTRPENDLFASHVWKAGRVSR